MRKLLKTKTECGLQLFNLELQFQAVYHFKRIKIVNIPKTKQMPVHHAKQ